MQSQVLKNLLNQTWASPVFGDSFDSSVNSQAVFKQISEISGGVQAELFKVIRSGMPELTEQQVAKIVGQIVPKTVSFCPALTAGEIADSKKLQAVATAIGIMYWGDQTTDRGDEAMPFAIRLLGGLKTDVPPELREKVGVRLKSLKQIEVQIKLFARPEDVKIVLDCFIGQVLLREVRMQELSMQYLKSTNKAAFLASNAPEISELMVITAGLPSVGSSLYAIYRHQDPSLPSLNQVYDDKQITTLLQVCNAVVRGADEFGDWKMDSGENPEWGIFVINLFNQAEPKFIQEFLKLAGIQPEPKITHAFLNFPKDRAANGQYLMQVFFGHVKNYIKNLPAETKAGHELYIKICKRVLEIGKVNEIGDMALSG